VGEEIGERDFTDFVEKVRANMFELLTLGANFEEDIRQLFNTELEQHEEDKNDDEGVRANVANPIIVNRKPKHKSFLPNDVNFVRIGHEDFNLVLNIMLGIKRATDAVIHIPLYNITDKDYTVKLHYSNEWMAGAFPKYKVHKFH
jgi:hypothetical protein